MNGDDRRASWLISVLVAGAVALYVVLNWDAVGPEVADLFSSWLR